MQNPQADLGGLDRDPLANVREGMHVVDAAGREVGRVQYVQMGDPEAVTTAGNDGRPGGLVGLVGDAVLPGEREPDVPEPLRSQLQRTGYIKIDGPDLMDTDRYVGSDHVREVGEDRVRLDVGRDRLAREA